MIHEQPFVTSTSEMLEKLPFHRGAKGRKMKKNEGNEEKWGEENGGVLSFMTNCSATCSLAWGHRGYLQPLILATSSYRHLW